MSLFGIANNDAIKKGLEWLQAERTDKQTDYGWGFENTCESRTYYTCFVIQTIYDLQDRYGYEYCKSLQPHLESSIHWLINNQNGDGSWGACKGENNSYFFTAYVVTTLIRIKKPSLKYIITKGLDWLEQNLQAKHNNFSSIECNLELIENQIDKVRSRIPYFHYSIPYVLTALIKGNRKHSNFIFEGYSELINKFKDGYWKHPFIENSNIKPIWAINDSIQALLLWNKNFNPNNSTKVKFYIYKFNHIWAIKSYNPLRFFIWVGKKTIGVLMLTFLLFIILQFKNHLIKYVPDYIRNEENIVNFVISLAASITYGIIPILVNCIKRLACSFSQKNK